MTGPRPPVPWWRSLNRPAIDATVAAALFALMAFELAGQDLQAGEGRSTPAAYLLAALITVPFAFHRRYPIASMTVCLLAVVGYSLGHFSAFPGYPLFALVFAIALHSDWRRALVTFVAGVLALAVSLSLQPAGVVTASTWVATMLAMTVAWLSGENLRTRRGRWIALEERARRLEREREERARQAVTDERLRIARELHDVVAHSMSVIAVQAGVANHVIDSRPELARQALSTVESASRAALVEMRRLLGVLRQADEPSASLAPPPGLAEVPALVAQFAATGLAVEVHIDGDQYGLPEGVDLSAYRIVQEGLTNVLRHGGPAARVTIGYPGAAVTVEVRDEGRPGAGAPDHAGPGRGAPEPGAGRGSLLGNFSEPGGSTGGGPTDGGPGHGLIGMRERVAVFGGRFEAGPQPGGGFRLRATLPFTDPAPAGGLGEWQAVGSA